MSCLNLDDLMVGALNSLCTPSLLLMTKNNSLKGHDWDLPGWWRAAPNHATSYATAGGEFKNQKKIATKTGLCTTDKYLYNCGDKYLPVRTGTSDRARHPSPQGKLRTMRHYVHFALHDHHTPPYIPPRWTLGSDSERLMKARLSMITFW